MSTSYNISLRIYKVSKEDGTTNLETAHILKQGIDLNTALIEFDALLKLIAAAKRLPK